mmetsp:Transcript_38249/g.92261  ORF Transcript_38249/g.92261 Transcript_38249/m.92261 type:complete len:239 (-) Transcript_38249:729-1445(-)
MCLLQLFHERGSQELCHPQCLHGNTDGCHPLGLLARNGVLRHNFLNGDVIRVLGEKVWHGCRVRLCELLHVRPVLLIGHPVTEYLRSLCVRHGGVGVGAPASIGGDAYLLARLGLDGEFDLVKVGELFTRRAREGLHAGEFLVGRDALDVLDGDIVEGDKEGELVDGHILEHSLGVTLEAFSKGFGRVFVGIVGDEGHVRSGNGLGKFARLSDVFANILVVPHQNAHACSLRLVLHPL